MTTLKSIRTRYGLSQRQLAAMLRVDVRSIGRWERGEKAFTGAPTVILELMETGELPQRYWV